MITVIVRWLSKPLYAAHHDKCGSHYKQVTLCSWLRLLASGEVRSAAHHLGPILVKAPSCVEGGTAKFPCRWGRWGLMMPGRIAAGAWPWVGGSHRRRRFSKHPADRDIPEGPARGCCPAIPMGSKIRPVKPKRSCGQPGRCKRTISAKPAFGVGLYGAGRITQEAYTSSVTLQ